MPRRVQLDAVGTKLELEDFKAQDEPVFEEEIPENAWQRTPLWLRAVGSLVVIVLVAAASFEFAYAGKIYPGVTADGVDVGGLSAQDAAAKVQNHVSMFEGEALTIKYTGGQDNIPLADINAHYNVKAVVDQALAVGRSGSLLHHIDQQVGAVFGQSVNVSSFSFNQDAYANIVSRLDDDIVTPVTDASINFAGAQAQVSPEHIGLRLDFGRLTQLVDSSLAMASTSPITAPVYQLSSTLATGPLTAALSQIDQDVAGPITIDNQGTYSTIDQQTIISWMDVTATVEQPFLSSLNLADIYPLPSSVNIGLDPAKVKAYVAGLASSIDVAPVNAGVTWQNNQAVITSPSKTGLSLDQTDAYNQIMAALKASGNARLVTLKVTSTPAEVNKNNLASLGITQKLSEGITNYYWSPAARIGNFTLAANKFNNVLLSPGETFSFGKILGPAGTAQGYAMGYVILSNKEVPAPGGGICQVVTTVFRAALLAGLPITDRTNHAFAISYYLWPYSIPGVDATLYYPELDFKFLNDTGHWILIQTHVDLSANTLSFDFYGTKTKVGVIRGPYYVTSNGTLTSNSNYRNANESSHTVFYQDVENLQGKVIKTYTFNSYYKPQSDFPPEAD